MTTIILFVKAQTIFYVFKLQSTGVDQNVYFRFRVTSTLRNVNYDNFIR